MKFAQISQRGFLDMILVSILAIRGGVRLGSDYLRVLSVPTMVGRRPVRQQLRAASPTRPANGLWLWARLGLS
jgi:hypothetical protein